jgi:hypothetical protein
MFDTNTKSTFAHSSNSILFIIGSVVGSFTHTGSFFTYHLFLHLTTYLLEKAPSADVLFFSSRIWSGIVLVAMLVVIQSKWKQKSMTIGVFVGWLGIWVVSTRVLLWWISSQ